MLASVLKGPASSLSQSMGQSWKFCCCRISACCSAHCMKLKDQLFSLCRFCMKLKDQLFFSQILLLVSDVDECFQSFALSPYFYLLEVANFYLKCNLLM